MNAEPPPMQHFNELDQHQPYVSADLRPPELTWSAIVVGAVLGIIFGASSLYLVLKVGMTVSASIPIAVLSITVFRLLRPVFGRNATILENNIVQTGGSAGESIAFGVGVTMPALLILGYNLELTRVMLVAVLGGLLGVLMMIPLRRAFIVRQHGKLAYPEGTACADVLIVGERGGTSAKTVFAGFGIALLYQFLMDALKLWKKEPEWRLWKETVEGTIGFRGAAVSGELAPALLGVGYIIGTRISCIMVAGGVLASWVLIPAIMLFGVGLDQPLYPAEKPIREMELSEVWHDYVLYIGAGAVAAGGIISMIQALPLIIASAHSGLRSVRAAGRSNAAGPQRVAVLRTERDLPLKVVIFGALGIVAGIWAAPMLHMNALGAVLIVLFGFLFVTVSSRLTGEIGSSSNPISGMTVATLLMTCLVFLLLGWTTAEHKLTALSIAGIVCIAASNGGTTSQDLKTGFLVGATPSSQQVALLIGALSSALVIGVTLLALNDAATVYSTKNLPAATLPVPPGAQMERAGGQYAGADAREYYAVHLAAQQVPGVRAGKYLVDERGTAHYIVDPGINGQLKQRDDGLPVDKYNAPKAALMSFVIDGILSQKMPWSLVLLGVAIALVLELIGVPSLPFAVGVYLPLSASTPIFIGGLVRWIADRGAGRTASDSEMSPGVLLSSGYIAGGAITGIAVALISINAEVARAMNIGTQWLGELADADSFALLPFGVLVAILLLVGAGWILRSPAGGASLRSAPES
jgi:putative OPT family oligopeptide transporter